MRKFFGRIVLVLSALALITSVAWAGTPGQHGGGHHHKKTGFFKKIGKAIHGLGHKIENGIKDGYVNAKHKITGKKNRVWVVGHWNKDGKHVKGHWRYIKHGHGGHGNPGQGDNPGQGEDPGQGQPVPPEEPPAPPAEPPAPPAEPPAPPAEPPAPPAEPPAPPAEPPAPPAEPPAPPAEPPSNPGQGSDQSGQSGHKKTLGGLMEELVSLSDDMTQIKNQALDSKKDKAKKQEADEIEASYQDLSADREEDAKTLVKVITKDLDKNQGAAGVYYAAYLRNMKNLTKAERESIQDVTEAIKTFIRHNSGKSDKSSSAFKTRLKELNQF